MIVATIAQLLLRQIQRVENKSKKKNVKNKEKENEKK